MAKTAVVAGTATAVSNRVSRRQANRWSAQQEPAPQQQAPPPQQQYQEPPPPAYAPPPPPPPADDAPDMLDQLQKLGELWAAGVLTEAEFAAQKAKILAQ
jgi:hypothetical protein